VGQNVKRGLNRLFLVLTLAWATFWAILYPLYFQWEGQDKALTEYDKENKNCDKLIVENPAERDLIKNCYQRSQENFINTLRFYSFSHFWAYPAVNWRIFLPLVVVPPAVVYGLAALAVWVWNGFRSRTSQAP
jgi:hypothetical protein